MSGQTCRGKYDAAETGRIAGAWSASLSIPYSCCPPSRTSPGNEESDNGALNAGTHLQLAPQILSPPLHARKSVPFTIDSEVKSSSIIFDPHSQSSALHLNFDDSS